MSRRAGMPAMLMAFILATGWGSALAAERRTAAPAGQTPTAAAGTAVQRERATRQRRATRPAGVPRTTARAHQLPQARPSVLPAVQSKAGLWQLAPRKDNAGWVSPAGVEYEAYGYGHDTRVDVVLEHLVDKPSMGIYGVFDGKEHPLALIDEAFERFRASPKGGKGIEVASDAKRTLVTVDLGRAVGFVGGKAGQNKGNPASQKLQLVLDPNAGNKLITAYPAAPPSGYQRAPRTYEASGGRADPRFGGPKKVTNPLKVSKLATDATVVAGPYAARAKAATKKDVIADLIGRGVPAADARKVAEHVMLGLPTDAGGTDENDYLSYEPEYVVSYNKARNTPNWVSWVVKPEHIGPDIRSPKFTRAQIKKLDGQGKSQAFDTVDFDAVVGSGGYHRGHNRRSGETTGTPDMNARTYDGKNITMQAENNNMGPWNGLENYYREYVTSGKHNVHVISGPVFPKGKQVKTLGKSANEAERVAVPEETFKIVVVMPKGKLPGQAKPVRVMSIITPNCQDSCPLNGNWADYRVSINEIEQRTGYRFLDTLATKQADGLRESVDKAYVPLVLGTHAAELFERRGGKLPPAANSNTPAGEARMHTAAQP